MLGQQATASHDQCAGKLIHPSPSQEIIQALADATCRSCGQYLIEARQYTQLAPRPVAGHAGIDGAVEGPGKIRMLADDLGYHAGIDLRVTVEEAEHDAIGTDRSVAAQQTLEPDNFAAIGGKSLT
jgi:hypothetical protein